MNLDLFDIEVFCKVADFKSMNKAAQFLHISQSAVSTRTANLEAELGTVLFIRSKSGVSLTLSGSKFYIYAGNALKLLQSGIDHTKHSKVNKNQISIGITEPLYQSMSPSLSAIIQDHPQQEWKISTGRSKELVYEILSQQLDMAIINNSPNLENKELIQTTLFEERIMLISPSNYRKNWVSFQYFIQEGTFILVEKGLPLREIIDKQIFKPLNVYPKRVIEVNTTSLIKEFVNNGVGFTFLPLSSLWQGKAESESSREQRKYGIYDLQGIKPSQKYICISNLQSQNPSIAYIIKMLQQLLQQNIHIYKSHNVVL